MTLGMFRTIKKRFCFGCEAFRPADVVAAVIAKIESQRFISRSKSSQETWLGFHLLLIQLSRFIRSKEPAIRLSFCPFCSRS